MSKYLTKSITHFKIQERETSEILECYVNYFILKKISYYSASECNDPAIKEMQKELFNRVIKPLFIPILTLSLCFLLFFPKENSKHKFSRILIFFLGLTIIILTELFSSMTSRSFFYFKISIGIPFLIFFIQYLYIFFKINTFRKN